MASAYNSFLSTAMSKSELSRFQADMLQMDDQFTGECGAVTDSVVRFLQGDVPMSVEKTIKGGSLGKGTAIRGSCDLDAVVFLREFRDMDDFLRKKDDVLEQIKYHLQQTNYCKRGDLRVNRVTAFFVNFELRVRQQWIAVDLLPAYDNIGRKGAENVYREMGRLSEWDRNPYSSSLVQLQLDFVKTRPAAVKNLIRLVKHWRKTCIPETKGRGWLPSSYPLELITIGVWENQGCPVSFDLRKGLKAVLNQINDYEHMNFSWTTNYSSSILRKEMGEPLVLDPANPYQNVAANCRWNEVARHARTAMQMPLLKDISCYSWQ